ncbi:MAG TPA: hypothetical protein VM370_00505 [Candidatus Thermoplasmatota archaeon]|nr:hypothetical protein [Candidatus Thermoplasmatota archaeon]
MAVLVMAAALSGCSVAGPARSPTPGAGRSAEDAWILGPAGFAELDVEMAKDAAIEYVLDGSAPVAWDLHSHEPEGGAVEHAQGSGTHASGRFVAPRADVYSLAARAGDDGANVSVRIHGEFEVLR